METIKLTLELGEAIWAHAQACYPRECCGLVIAAGDGMTYVPCTNMDTTGAQDRFVFDKLEWADAEDAGDILAVVHSHPDASANPSDADKVMCERTGVPWIIIGVPSAVIKQYVPTGSPLPLLDRTFFHGVVDCYTLVRDYYQLRLGITLLDFEREDEWWARGPNNEPGQDLYVRHFAEAGFVSVGDPKTTQPQPHDVILMQIRSDQTNHAAIYDSERPGLFLHHLYGRPSCHDVWGGMWQSHHATHLLRHRDLIGGTHG